MRTFELKFSFNMDKQGFSSLNWRVFWISLAVGFITALLQMFVSQIQLHSNLLMISPITNSIPDTFHTLIPKLSDKTDSYSLFNKREIIAKTYSADSYDQAPAYIVTDYSTGEILLGKNYTERKPIASLTKIMTAVVTLDLAKPDELFTASSHAAGIQPTKIGLVSGQKLSVRELLHALLMTSANDAAEMISEGIDMKYGTPVFVKAMNRKAELLGMKNTSYDNPAGFDGNNNFSSAEDLAILSHYAMENYPLIAAIVKKDFVALEQNVNHKQYDLYNWNGLLGVYPDVFGVKIGNTDLAGKTTVVASNRQGKKILVVILGAPTVLERDLWASQLLDMGYQNTLGLGLVNVTREQLQAKYDSWRYWN